MIERDLVSIIKAHRAESLGASDGALSTERAEAMDRYHGRPFGNEEEGRSGVVSRDLSEAVDWLMPAVMRVFTQSGNIAEFEPVGPEDEELAQQESDAINRVVMQENNGFIVLHDGCKDAMLLKNAYSKQWWDVTTKITEEEYSGLGPQELMQLLQQLEGSGAEVKIKGQEERVVTIPGPQGDMQVPVYDIRLQITREEGKVRVEAVPCEEVRVSKTCRGALAEAAFVEHVTRKTRSDLREMGMPKDFVDKLAAYGSSRNSTEELARDSSVDENNTIEQSALDRSMDVIEYCEAYLKVDWDGDGIAELRKVVTVADQIPPGEEWNEQIDEMPITGGVIKRVPHRHVGESLHDELADLIEIKTTLNRQLLDNIYLTNNNQWLVNERVNLADFLQSLPGGVKRLKGFEPVSGAVEPVMTAPIAQQIMPVISYFDGVKQGRTGINESSTGMDPDTLKQTTKGAFLENLNRASQKVEMITRLLAETYVKPMLLSVHSLMVKHQDKPKMMRLRGRYVTVNPQEWRERSDLTIKVGLGTGNQEEKREHLSMLAGAQESLKQMGLVGQKQAYNLFTDFAKALGFDMPERYAVTPDPQNPEFQEIQQKMSGQKDPLVAAEEVKGQYSLQRAQVDQQGAAQKSQMDAQLERERMQMEAVAKEREAQTQAELEKWKAQLKAETDRAIAQTKIEAQVVVERMKAEMPPQLPVSINNDPQGDFAGAMGQMMTASAEQQKVMLSEILKALTRPRKVVKDERGRVSGIE